MKTFIGCVAAGILLCYASVSVPAVRKTAVGSAVNAWYTAAHRQAVVRWKRLRYVLQYECYLPISGKKFKKDCDEVAGDVRVGQRQVKTDATR